MLIGLGLVKKVVIADYLARAIVDPVFAVPQLYAEPDVLLAAYAYTAQIYCDFSGYTDIAIGLALLMGYVFPQNFRSPYRATGFRDFWRRWHMTLSRFLRDYLYIPLGGNRGGRLFTYRNLMITMVLGGLWHGAAWTFVAWGAFHGVGLVAEHALRRPDQRRPRGCGGRSRSTSSCLRLDPVPLREPGRRRYVPVAPRSVPGEATPADARPRAARSSSSSASSCCRHAPVERLQFRIERIRPLGSPSPSPCWSRSSARHRVLPGRRPVHLLPLLT